MYSIRSLTGGDFLYKNGSRVDFKPTPHKNSGWAVPPRFLVMHFTAAGPASGSVSWFQNLASKVSAHLVVERDGTVTQCAAFTDRTWHAGTSRWVGSDDRLYEGLNSFGIGIELANAGACQLTASGRWINGLGVQVAASDIVEAQHRNGPVWFESKFGLKAGAMARPGWEVYPQAQIEAARAIAILLVDKYGLKEIVGHDDISPGRKNDPGPMFDMDGFRDAAFGEGGEDGGIWKVRADTPGGLSIRVAPSKDATKVRDQNLPPGTRVIVNETMGLWWMVTVLNGSGQSDLDGWVYSKYLIKA